MTDSQLELYIKRFYEILVAKKTPLHKIYRPQESDSYSHSIWLYFPGDNKTRLYCAATQDLNTPISELPVHSDRPTSEQFRRICDERRCEPLRVTYKFRIHKKPQGWQSSLPTIEVSWEFVKAVMGLGIDSPILEGQYTLEERQIGHKRVNVLRLNLGLDEGLLAILNAAKQFGDRELNESIGWKYICFGEDRITHHLYYKVRIPIISRASDENLTKHLEGLDRFSDTGRRYYGMPIFSNGTVEVRCIYDRKGVILLEVLPCIPNYRKGQFPRISKKNVITAVNNAANEVYRMFEAEGQIKNYKPSL